MTKEITTLKAELREQLGKGASRALRREGKVPAVVYGVGQEPVHLALDEKEVVRLAAKIRFHSSLVKIDAGKKSFTVLPRELQLHPVTDRPEHLDLQSVNDNSRVHVSVPVKIVGHDKSPGLKRGGTLNVIRREVELFCKATNIPTEILVDLTGLKIAESVHLSSIKLAEGVVPVNVGERDLTLVTIVGRRGDKEEEAAEGATA